MKVLNESKSPAEVSDNNMYHVNPDNTSPTHTHLAYELPTRIRPALRVSPGGTMSPNSPLQEVNTQAAAQCRTATEAVS
jgi:hypothetical protein